MDRQRAEDGLDRGGGAARDRALRVAPGKVGLDLVGDDVILGQSVQLGQFRLEPQMQLGDEREQAHRIVAVPDHGAAPPVGCAAASLSYPWTATYLAAPPVSHQWSCPCGAPPG